MTNHRKKEQLLDVDSTATIEFNVAATDYQCVLFICPLSGKILANNVLGNKSGTYKPIP